MHKAVAMLCPCLTLSLDWHVTSTSFLYLYFEPYIFLLVIEAKDPSYILFKKSFTFVTPFTIQGEYKKLMPFQIQISREFNTVYSHGSTENRS